MRLCGFFELLQVGRAVFPAEAADRLDVEGVELGVGVQLEDGARHRQLPGAADAFAVRVGLRLVLKVQGQVLAYVPVQRVLGGARWRRHQGAG